MQVWLTKPTSDHVILIEIQTFDEFGLTDRDLYAKTPSDRHTQAIDKQVMETAKSVVSYLRQRFRELPVFEEIGDLVKGAAKIRVAQAYRTEQRIINFAQVAKQQDIRFNHLRNAYNENPSLSWRLNKQQDMVSAIDGLKQTMRSRNLHTLLKEMEAKSSTDSVIQIFRVNKGAIKTSQD